MYHVLFDGAYNGHSGDLSHCLAIARQAAFNCAAILDLAIDEVPIGKAHSHTVFTIKDLARPMGNQIVHWWHIVPNRGENESCN